MVAGEGAKCALNKVAEKGWPELIWGGSIFKCTTPEPEAHHPDQQLVHSISKATSAEQDETFYA